MIPNIEKLKELLDNKFGKDRMHIYLEVTYFGGCGGFAKKISISGLGIDYEENKYSTSSIATLNKLISMAYNHFKRIKYNK